MGSLYTNWISYSNLNESGSEFDKISRSQIHVSPSHIYQPGPTNSSNLQMGVSDTPLAPPLYAFSHMNTSQKELNCFTVGKSRTWPP